MNSDGSNQTRLTNNPATDFEPMFSPDATKIAFVSNRDGNYEIYVMNADGTGTPTNLSNNPANERHPSFSPDGTKIAFVSDRDGNNEIYVMNSDGTNQTRLTNNTASDFLPNWGVIASVTSTPTPTSTPTLCLPNFANPGVFNSAGDGVSIAAGDLNGVGGLDLATANFSTNNVSIFSSLVSSNPTNFAVGNGPSSIALADFDVDGHKDLVTANFLSDNVSILRNDGSGNFGPQPLNISVGSQPESVAVGDFNGDGIPDIATANSGSNNVSIVLINGALPTATNFAAGSVPDAIAVGDFNGDGRLDLVTANDASNDVSILIGDGSGAFGSPTSFAVGSGPSAVAVGDLNGDGHLDIVTSNFGSDNISVLIGDGHGGFGSPINVAVGSGPSSVAVGDFNGDGKLDVITANLNSNNVSLLFGDGSGGFPISPPIIAVGSGPSSIVAGDFNQDGSLDFATTDSASNVGNVSIRLGSGCAQATPTPTPTPTPAADMNVSIPNDLYGFNGAELDVPVNASDTTGRDIISFDYTLTYDPNVLTPAATAYDTAGTLSSGFTITTFSPGAGTLNVSGFGTTPLSGSGRLLTLKFNVVGSPPACTSIGFAAFVFNEGSPSVQTAAGTACVISGNISGTVTYGTSTTAVPVPNVTITAAGAPQVSTLSGTNGTYQLSSLGPGPYTVTPSKSGDVNGISAFDAALVAQKVVGIITFSPNQTIAADVSGNGTVTSFDAALIAQYVVGIPNAGLNGMWKFTPADRTYPSTTSAQTGQDYLAILMGEVSGNWTPPVSAGLLSKPRKRDSSYSANLAGMSAVNVSLPDSSATASSSINVPIKVDQDLQAQGILSYEIDLNYDPAVLQPENVFVENAGTISYGMNITVNNSTAGRSRIAAFGAFPVNGSGTLLNLRFTVVGAPGQVSPLSWNRFVFNEGNPTTSLTNGQINVVHVANNTATVAGRVLTYSGSPIYGARITMTDASGNISGSLSNPFGYFQFENVQEGQSYTFHVTSKRYKFINGTQTFVLNGDVMNLNFVSSP